MYDKTHFIDVLLLVCHVGNNLALHTTQPLYPSCSLSVVAKVVGRLLFTAGSLIHYQVSPVGVVVDTLGLWQSFCVSMLFLLCQLFSIQHVIRGLPQYEGTVFIVSPLPSPSTLRLRFWSGIMFVTLF